MIAVSACLAGICCRYDGQANTQEEILEWVKKGEAILICPEQLGGLSTPRLPCEIQSIDGLRKVINSAGEDKTQDFLKGAQEALKICQMYGIKKAILKAKSPSCGHGQIYNGHFNRTLVEGSGLTAELLVKNGIEVEVR